MTINDESANGKNRSHDASGAQTGKQKPSDQTPSHPDLERLWRASQERCLALAARHEELLKAAEKLEADRARYAGLYDEAPVAFFTLDREGAITTANQACASLLGANSSALIKRPFNTFLARDSRDVFQDLLKRVFARPDTQRADIHLNGRGDPRHISLEAVADKSGTECRAVALRISLGKTPDAPLSENKNGQAPPETANMDIRRESATAQPFETIIGQSDGFKYVLYRARQVAPTGTTVLILGETGTGKELLAAAIHQLSPRKDKPLITVNCAALPANLMESELFGHEKGAFTGADSRQAGRFETANGSTICLDEIGELPMDVQAKLLRVIQLHEFERLGSSRTIRVDVRIMATTNRNLAEEVKKGRFRQDLYYRLNVFPITVPPLRQRTDDIPLLANSFVDRFSRKLGKEITSIDPEAMHALQNYSWPGNIRELESVIERAVILCPGPVLKLADQLETQATSSSGLKTLEEIDRAQILKTLHDVGWRIEGKNGAADILGLNPSTLRARMHKLQIVRPPNHHPD